MSVTGIESGIAARIKEALKKFVEATQELSNILDETGYELSNAAPEYLRDVDDFAYEVTTFAEDEIEELKQVEEVLHSV